MEASERIIEAYLRAVKHCLTAANIKGRANKEIDLLAIDAEGSRYHIESSVKTSQFGVLKDKPVGELQTKPDKRRTLEFFKKEKFEHPYVTEILKKWGFNQGNYKKVIVVMRSDQEAEERAKEEGIEVWHFPRLVKELFEATDRPQFLSDEERIFQLIQYSVRKEV